MNQNSLMELSNMILSSDFDDNNDVITISAENEEELTKPDNLPELLNIMPLRNTVMFQGVLIPIHISRNSSVQLLKTAYNEKRLIGTIAQRDFKTDNPKFDDIYTIGTLSLILKILEMPDGTNSVIIQGLKRFRILERISDEPYLTAKVEYLDEVLPEPDNKEFEAITTSIKELSIKIIHLSNYIPDEAAYAIQNIENPAFLVNFVASNTDVEIKEKQAMLEMNEVKDRAIKLLSHLSTEVQKLELKDNIQSKVKTELDKQQRDYFLNQQIKAIQTELGGDPNEVEIDELKAKAKKKKWSKEIAETFNKELARMQRMHPMSPDYSYQSNYLHTLVELPWNKYTKDNFDLKRAQKVLDNDHFGLELVKERILEHLAVLKLKGDLKSPIICLYGPPGVGKTSLGKSIAKALNRKFARMSLGGLHDEAEIRGHRKTYVGALPGRIIQSLKKLKSSNPVFVLDEIDKIGNDFRGDPSSALLEVHDPEQNTSFYDNYLELEYDLSKVLFVATANSIGDIKPALLDRMELINVSGYLVEEKIEIAKRHLLPKQMNAHGVKKSVLNFSKEVLENIIVNYTHESGVRELDKTLAKVCRYFAKKIAMEDTINKKIAISDIRTILGVPKYWKEKYHDNEYAGVVTGLAWTSAGGQILFVETSLSRGQGRLTLTGNLGNVMKESATIALEYLKAHAPQLKIDSELFNNWNIHVHVPEGAIPKDGPSAGITMATSLASAFLQCKVKSHIAMTGEITLRGKVLPVGGTKEKILAAKRADIKEIILSVENRKDIEEIKDIYIEGLTFHYVKDIIEVLKIAILDEKVSNPLEISVPKKKKKRKPQAV